MTDSSGTHTLSLNRMFRRDIFSIPKTSTRVRYKENNNDYLWGTPMLKMTLEVQCCCVALIVMTQVWILAYFGSEIFEKLIRDELCLPILYLTAIIFGTVTYVRPTYWRITLSLTAYAVCIYFSMMVTNVAIKILMTPELAGILQKEPTSPNSHSIRVWIPWAVGFALHMQFCITSFFISMICLRDMYSFHPVYYTGRDPDVIGRPTNNSRRQSFLPMSNSAVSTIRVVAADGNNNGNSPHAPKGSLDRVFSI